MFAQSLIPVLTENMTRDGPQTSHIMQLPMELHIRIRDQLLTDPDSTFKTLRRLRLVCKTFDDIWTPVVMTNIILFQTDDTDRALAQLRHIVHGESNTSTLAAYTTLTIQYTGSMDTELDRWYSDARRLCDQGIVAVLRRMRMMLVQTLIFISDLVAFVAYLICTALAYCCSLISTALAYCYSLIFYLARLSVKASNSIKRAIPKFRGRYYMALLPRKLDMPNIRRVRLLLGYKDSDWVIYRTTRILLSFPHLTELELGLAETTDVEYLVRCLKSLHSLHKLTVLPKQPAQWPPSYLACIAALISNNENLTHLDWRPLIAPDFSALFSDVPTYKPLKLHHLSLSRSGINYDVLIPHIRSLTSVEFREKEQNRWCISFSQAKIFPPIIKVELLDQELIRFIRGHPGLVSLSIGGSTTQGTYSPLWEALTHHSETLQFLIFKSNILAFMLQDAENKANFLLSTGNLRELVLETDLSSHQYRNATSRRYSEQKILPIVAHLSQSVTVIIKTNYQKLFVLCVAFCRNSEDPLIRDLAGRIMYERLVET